jgi:hypothetical protein
MNNRIEIPVNNVPNPTPVFAEALRTDSNLELEWLWFAAQIERDDERAYCLRRALYINPDSPVALQELQRMGNAPECGTAQEWRTRLARVVAQLLASRLRS